MSETEKLAALKAGDWIEFWGNQSPKCPHCAEVYCVAENEAWELYDDSDRHAVDCPSCGHEFTVTTHTTHTFSTDEQEEE